jgi:hypothetical protein
VAISKTNYNMRRRFVAFKITVSSPGKKKILLSLRRSGLS